MQASLTREAIALGARQRGPWPTLQPTQPSPVWILKSSRGTELATLPMWVSMSSGMPVVGHVMLLGSPSTVKKPEKQRLCALWEALGPQIPASLAPPPHTPPAQSSWAHLLPEDELNLRTVAADATAPAPTPATILPRALQRATP